MYCCTDDATDALEIGLYCYEDMGVRGDSTYVATRGHSKRRLIFEDLSVETALASENAWDSPVAVDDYTQCASECLAPKKARTGDAGVEMNAVLPLVWESVESPGILCSPECGSVLGSGSLHAVSGGVDGICAVVIDAQQSLSTESDGQCLRSELVELYNLSKHAHEEDNLLNDCILHMRAECTVKMGRILHETRLWNKVVDGALILDEVRVVSAVLFMQWLSRRHTTVFVETRCAMVSCACVLLHLCGAGSVSGDNEDEREEQLAELYHAMALCVFDTGVLHRMKEIVELTVSLRGLAAAQYRAMDFSLFVDAYYPCESHTKQRLMQFLLSYIKENTLRPRNCMYHTFVEITIREAEDMETRHEIFFDYALLKNTVPSRVGLAF